MKTINVDCREIKVRLNEIIQHNDIYYKVVGIDILEGWRNNLHLKSIYIKIIGTLQVKA